MNIKTKIKLKTLITFVAGLLLGVAFGSLISSLMGYCPLGVVGAEIIIVIGLILLMYGLGSMKGILDNELE